MHPFSFAAVLLLSSLQGAFATTSISASCAVAPAVPAPPSGATVLPRSSGGDDTALIQQALKGLKSGDSLVFQPGTYNISKHLVLNVSAVTLFGNGATIHATNPTDGALMIEGDNVRVYGFTFTQDVTTRQTTPWAGGISVISYNTDTSARRITGSIIQNNVFTNTAGGIFLDKVSMFTVANNTVYRTLADGIHMTAGSSNGRVIHNTVSQNGDDMIAVVSYAGNRAGTTLAQQYANWGAQQDELDQNIYIGQNTVSDNYWGRGISVVGGSNITIESNNISKTSIGAGIYLTRETSYLTFGDQNIFVDNNVVSQVQTEPATYKPAGFSGVPTHQGAIEVAAQMTDAEYAVPQYRSAFSVVNVALIGNTVQNAKYAGIRLGMYSPPNTVNTISVIGDALDNVENNGVIQPQAGLAASAISCSGNTYDGANWGANCATAIAPITANYAITGASLQCDQNGLIASSTDSRSLPPSNLTVQ